jgi:serine/threonine protein kinase
MRCNPQLLWTLVHQNSDPPQRSKKLFAHLETCARCRDTLVELAGGATWEQDATHWLEEVECDTPDEAGAASGNVVGDRPFAVSCSPKSTNSNLTSSNSTESERDDLTLLDLRFLEPPAHPEFLGRIGRYDIESVLGRGGMGIVLRGFDTELQRAVAIKVLAPEWTASDAARRRFAREAQAAASVAHESVVPIYNVGADASPPYIVMRYIPGVTLQQMVDHQGPLPAPLILRITSQLAHGLAAAHARSLVHRDVKPANVLVGENTDRVWLSDFGLARAADEARLTRTGTIAGTPHYMSPEQARGEPLDGRSDWFSLGCLIYFMSTGVPPFDAPSTLAILQQTISAKPKPLAKLRPDLPEALVDLVNHLLAKRPDKRPADLVAVDGALRLADLQISGRQGIMNRKAIRRLAAGISLVVLLVLGAWSTSTYWVAEPDRSGQEETHLPAKVLPTNPWDFDTTSEILEAQDRQLLSDNPSNQQLTQRELAQAIEAIAGWDNDNFDREVQQIETALEAAFQARPQLFFL